MSTSPGGVRRPAGPGRGKSRARATARATQKAVDYAGNFAGSVAKPVVGKVNRITKNYRLTKRALWLLAIFAVIVFSYARSMQVYFQQQHDLAVAQQHITEQTKKIGDLESEIQRWKDPNFVKAQARERLGWVMPDEVGYRLITDDGKLMGNGVSLSESVDTKAMWWDRMWGSLKVADAPAVR